VQDFDGLELISTSLSNARVIPKVMSYDSLELLMESVPANRSGKRVCFSSTDHC
jgi:hypothetical protein